MPYTAEVRAQIARGPSGKPCCARAELTALIRCSGGAAYVGGGRYTVSIDSGSESAMAYLAKKIERFCGADGTMRLHSSARLGGQEKYRLAYDGAGAERILRFIGNEREPSPFRSAGGGEAGLERECCRRAYLRGAFLGCGRASDPSKAYSLEFSAPDEGEAARIVRVLSRCGVPSSVAPRKRRAVVYLKEGERIATVLALIGAHRASLAVENERILRGIRNSVNRQVICDERNVDRSLAAARAQIGAIRAIERASGLDSLPASLREIAELRLRHEAASYEELGAMLDPPIGKSGVNNRLRRIGKLAEGLHVGKDSK